MRGEFIGLVPFIVLALSGSVGAQTVDLGTNAGAVNYNLSGYHKGFDNFNPPDSVVLPLKPKYNQNNFLSYERTIALGGVHENQYGTGYEGNHDGGYPGDGGNWAPWEDYVENTILRPLYVTPGKTAGLQMEVWNEPDNPEFWSSNRPVSQFYEAYRRAVIVHRSIVPAVPVVGPGNAFSDRQIGGGSFSVREFLVWAQTNNVLPDVLDWHEIVAAYPYLQTEFIGRVTAMRQWLVANDNGSGKLAALANNIQIGEWGYPGQHLAPGSIIVSLANLQRAGIVRAGAACWDDVGSPGNNLGCSRSVLAGAVSPPTDIPPYQTRAKWWAHKAYADLTGHYVLVTGNNGFDGMAALDTGVARVILGNVGGNAASSIVLQNVGALTGAAQVQVNVRRIPATGFATLAAPFVVSETTLPVTGGRVTIPISGSVMWDAYTITVTPAGGLPPPGGPVPPSGLRVTRLTWSDSETGVSRNNTHRAAPGPSWISHRRCQRSLVESHPGSPVGRDVRGPRSLRLPDFSAGATHGERLLGALGSEAVAGVISNERYARLTLNHDRLKLSELTRQPPLDSAALDRLTP
jgi:hypothetical protein